MDNETHLLIVMKTIFHHSLIVFLLFLPVTKLMAQSPALKAGIGISSIRGELVDDNPLEDKYGTDFSAGLILPMSNERWAFTTEAIYTSQNEEHDFVNNPKILFKKQPETELFQTYTQQAFLGVGLRFYLTSTINRYNPYQGQLLPYLGFSIGGLYTSVNLTGTETVPEAYGIRAQKGFEVTAQLEGGFGYVLNRRVTLEFFGALRPGFSDYWDGIKGVTETNDWLARAGVGIQYRLK